MRGRVSILVVCGVLLAGNCAGQALVHLTFDDPKNLAADQSGRGHHGSIEGNVSPSQSGRAGGAALLDGTSAIGLGSEVAQVLGGSFTVSLWVRTTQRAGGQPGDAAAGIGLVYAPGDAGSDPLPVALTGDRAGFSEGDTTLHSQSAINRGEWVNVVVTRDASTGRSSLFVNGQLEADAQRSATAQAVHNFLLLGANPATGLNFAGELDDFQLYDRAIPASDVALLHANPGSALFLTVPEPSTSALLGAGLLVAFSLAWRQRRRSATAARPSKGGTQPRHALRQIPAPRRR